MNIYAPDSRAQDAGSKNLTEVKGETDISTIIVGDFSPLLSVVGRTGQKINKETEGLNNYKPTTPKRHV